MKKGRRLAWACFALILLAATVARAAAAESYDIDTVLSLTGAGAFVGTQQREALPLIEKMVNASGGIHGRPVHFIVHDDQSSPQIAVQVTSGILAGHPKVILGTSLVAACNAMARLAKEGPVVYCLSTAMQPPAGGYAFAASASTEFQAEALLRYFRASGWKRIALITSTDATGQDGDRNFGALLAEPAYQDMSLVAHSHFNTNDVSVAAQMAELRAAAPDAVIFWASGTPAATVLRGLVQAGADLPVGTVGSNMTYAQMTQYAAFLPRRFFLPNPEWPAAGNSRFGLDPRVAALQKQLYAAYAEAGIKVDAASVDAWDPAMLLVGALRALKPDATATEIRDYLARRRDQPGVQGLYDFVKQPQRGLWLGDILVTCWSRDDNRWNVVSTPGGLPAAGVSANSCQSAGGPSTQPE